MQTVGISSAMRGKEALEVTGRDPKLTSAYYYVEEEVTAGI